MVPSGSTAARRSPRIGPARAGAVVALAIILAGCGSTGTPTASSAVVVTPTATAQPTPTATAQPTPTATAEPTPTATPEPTPTQTTAPSATPAFACTKLPYGRPNDVLSVRVADVRAATHAGYDRMVWEFVNGRLPDIVVSRAKPPFKLDPSDLPVTIDGTAFLKIHLTHVAVETVPADADDMTPGYPMLLELRQTAGYEGDATWIAGLAGPACVRVMILKSPARLVVDVAPAG
jgi:hypothetical protein